LQEDCDLPQLKTSFSEGALNPFGGRGKGKEIHALKNPSLYPVGELVEPFLLSPFLGKNYQIINKRLKRI